MVDASRDLGSVMDGRRATIFRFTRTMVFLLYCSNDCHDNSDEKPSLCQAEQCPAGQFQCQNKQCIPYEVVCNGVRNCTDGSDEPASCGRSRSLFVLIISTIQIGVNECASAVLSGCEHGCVNTLTSFRCTCRPGYKLAPNQKNCWGKIRRG